MRAFGETLFVGCRPAEYVAKRRLPAYGDVSAGFHFAPLPWRDMREGMHLVEGLDDANSARSELARLMARVADKDSAAFKSVYERTSAKLYGVALRLLGDEAEAQDVLQEVYILIWRKAALFDLARAGAITWLATLARNKAIDRLRGRRAPEGDADDAASLADDSPSSLDMLEKAEDASRVRQCLEELEERARTMIRSAFFDGATYPELAEKTGVPLPTMKSWIRRGLQHLRGCLER
ncbi:MAG: sigma-70 family RNA polymerase sigma factor [Sphingomicrobium sp.]